LPNVNSLDFFINTPLVDIFCTAIHVFTHTEAFHSHNILLNAVMTFYRQGWNM